MNSNSSSILGTVVAVVALVFALFAFATRPAAAPLAGAVTGVSNYDKIGAMQLKVGTGCNSSTGYSGCTGSAVSKVLFGTCNASQKTPGSLAASTTGQFYCAVTGAASGDVVYVTLPVGAGTNADGSGSLAQGFSVVSANATSTGYIQFSIANNTGAATSSFRQATTSVSYIVID